MKSIILAIEDNFEEKGETVYTVYATLRDCCKDLDLNEHTANFYISRKKDVFQTGNYTIARLPINRIK